MIPDEKRRIAAHELFLTMVESDDPAGVLGREFDIKHGGLNLRMPHQVLEGG